MGRTSRQIDKKPFVFCTLGWWTESAARLNEVALRETAVARRRSSRMVRKCKIQVCWVPKWYIHRGALRRGEETFPWKGTRPVNSPHAPRVVVQQIGMGHRGTSVLVRGGMFKTGELEMKSAEASLV